MRYRRCNYRYTTVFSNEQYQVHEGWDAEKLKFLFLNRASGQQQTYMNPLIPCI